MRGGRVVDPARGLDAPATDVLIESGRFAAVGPGLVAPGVPVLEARGLVVAPGFLDMHVHLREPGMEEAETVLSGLEAAVRGGFTAVAAMANTMPVNDCQETTRALLARAGAARLARVHPVAAITRGLLGAELTDFAVLQAAGAVALSDDGKPVASCLRFREALERASPLGLLLIDHCEEPTLPGDAAGEEIMVARDAVLAREGSGRVHIAHISTRGAIERVREERRRGTLVSSEVTPHHFTLTRAAVKTHGTHAKMNPPLRETGDLESVLEALRDGTIDCIASDHAPHPAGEKSKPFDQAPNGITGLETAVGLALDGLYHAGVVTLTRLVELMSRNPARLLGVEGGTLAIGAPADLTLLDLERWQVVDADASRSRSRNTPFAGRKLRGMAVATVVGGRVVYRAGAP